MAGAGELVAPRIELALDRQGELGLGARIVLHELGQSVDRESRDGRIQHRPGVEVLPLEEAETQIIAGEAELDDRLAVAAGGLVEAHRAALDTIKVRSGIARLENEGVGRDPVGGGGRRGGGSRDSGGGGKRGLETGREPGFALDAD